MVRPTPRGTETDLTPFALTLHLRMTVHAPSLELAQEKLDRDITRFMRRRWGRLGIPTDGPWFQWEG